MKNFCKVLKTDFFRAFCSRGFLIGTAAVIGVFFFGYVGMGAPSAVAAFNNDLKYNNISGLLCLCATFAYAAGFCTDWQTRFAIPLLVRSGRRSYLFSKCVVSAAAGGVSVAGGAGVFIIFLCVTSNQILPSVNEIENEFSNQAFGDLLVRGDGVSFFLCYLCVIFFAAAFFSSLGLAVSGIFPNKYVAYITPFALSFLLNQLANKFGFPVWMNPMKLAVARVMGVPTPEILRMVVANFLCFTVLCDGIFIYTARRRLING